MDRKKKKLMRATWRGRRDKERFLDFEDASSIPFLLSSL